MKRFSYPIIVGIASLLVFVLLYSSVAYVKSNASYVLETLEGDERVMEPLKVVGSHSGNVDMYTPNYERIEVTLNGSTSKGLAFWKNFGWPLFRDGDLLENGRSKALLRGLIYPTLLETEKVFVAVEVPNERKSENIRVRIQDKKTNEVTKFALPLPEVFKDGRHDRIQAATMDGETISLFIQSGDLGTVHAVNVDIATETITQVNVLFSNSAQLLWNSTSEDASFKTIGSTIEPTEQGEEYKIKDVQFEVYDVKNKKKMSVDLPNDLKRNWLKDNAVAVHVYNETYYFMVGRNSQRIVYAYDAMKEEWSEPIKLSIPDRSKASTTSTREFLMDHSFYLIESSSQTKEQLHIYDLNTGKLQYRGMVKQTSGKPMSFFMEDVQKK